MNKKQPHQLEQTKNFMRNFLRINDSREFLVFLFFLFAAFIFWYLTTMSQEYEMKYKVRLELKRLPENLIVTEPLPQEITVVLKDKGDKLVEYKARGIMKNLFIDHRQHHNTMGRTAIYGAELNKILSAGLASSTSIVSISLDTLQYYVADARGVKLPVHWHGVAEADKQHVIEQVRVVPDSVIVYAAPQLKDTMTAVYVSTARLVGLTDSVSQTIDLTQGNRGVRYEPAEVALEVAVSPYVMKSVQVPIEGYMFPYGQQLKTFPSKANVRFRVSLNDFREVTEEDFKIRIRHSQLNDNNSGKVTLSVDEAPKNAMNIVIEPAEVDYLIEMDASL
jgi:hypothetical protein